MAPASAALLRGTVGVSFLVCLRLHACAVRLLLHGIEISGSNASRSYKLPGARLCHPAGRGVRPRKGPQPAGGWNHCRTCGDVDSPDAGPPGVMLTIRSSREILHRPGWRASERAGFFESACGHGEIYGLVILRQALEDPTRT